MQIVLLVLAMLVSVSTAYAETLVPPEVVRLENVKVEGDIRTVYMGNANRHYVLFCNIKADGCFTPSSDKNYLLFNANTRWKMPGAKDFLTLKFMQDWTVKYNQGENIGLIAEDPSTKDPGIGMFVLDKTGGGYEQDTIFSDGPIIYGAGMSHQDRQKAWKSFWYKMVETSVHQQGADALGAKLAKRCVPGQDFCTIAVDADLVGIGRIQEPRRVLVMIVFDGHDQNKQLERVVCTYPAKDKRVCRDWDTGKLITDDMPTGQN